MTTHPRAEVVRREPPEDAARRVTRDSLGAWLIKCNPRVSDANALILGRTITSWCVARNYRAELMSPGDPVVFWISGSANQTPAPGVWGIGRLTGLVEVGVKPSVPMRVRLLDEPVPRAELLATAAFASLEVLRQPMGSNPSWLNQPEWLAMRRLLGCSDADTSPSADPS